MWSKLNLLASHHGLVYSAQSRCSLWDSSWDFGKAIPKPPSPAWFSRSFTMFAVCLGSLSCWKTQPHPRPNLLVDDLRFSWKKSDIILLLHCSIYLLPDPLIVKQPHNIILPLPCLTVGIVFSKASSPPLHTYRWSLYPNNSISVSSDYRVFLQKVCFLSIWSAAEFCQAISQ